MRVVDVEQVRVRVYLTEGDKAHHRPLYEALLERLRSEGFAGATVLRGVAGFGERRELHSTHVLRLAADLPVVLEVVETAAGAERLLALLDDVLAGALVTVEPVRALRFAPAAPPPP